MDDARPDRFVGPEDGNGGRGDDGVPERDRGHSGAVGILSTLVAALGVGEVTAEDVRAPDAGPATRAAPGGERRAASQERKDTALVRATALARRARTARQRDEIAEVRDATAAARDHIASARDRTADARDRAAVARAVRAREDGETHVPIDMFQRLRVAGARLRADAAAERTAAAADRAAAAEDRRNAATDRRSAGLDDLTGLLGRSSGYLALSRELERAHRDGQALVLVLVDVEELGAVNDCDGQGASEALLRATARAITSTLRPSDITVRWDGEAFVYTIPCDLETGRQRVRHVREALHARWPGGRISVGLAPLDHADSLESLLARADADRRVRLSDAGDPGPSR